MVRFDLQVVRGLTDLTADQMVAFSDCYGITERALDAPRLKNAHPENSSILRIGKQLNRLPDAHGSHTEDIFRCIPD